MPLHVLHELHDYCMQGNMLMTQCWAQALHQQIELLLSPIIRHEIIAIIAKQSVHYSHYLPIISLLSSYYLTIISLLFDLLSLPIIRYYLFQYYYALLSYLLYDIILNPIYYIHCLWRCHSVCLVTLVSATSNLRSKNWAKAVLLALVEWHDIYEMELNPYILKITNIRSWTRQRPQLFRNVCFGTSTWDRDSNLSSALCSLNLM